MNMQNPVFIGGTGRSGTTLMAALLDSHPDFCLPGNENKLIVERGGLKDIAHQLSGRYDILRNHFVMHDFLTRVARMRQFGFVSEDLNAEVKRLMAERNVHLHVAFEDVLRRNREAPASVHAIGGYFGLEHYDRCVADFVGRIVMHSIDEGIIDTDGLLKAFFVTRHFSRQDILSECRMFLDRLYAPRLAEAGASRWVDDTPSNCLYVDFLHELYPDMKFIHMIRNPGDVVSSYTN